MKPRKHRTARLPAWLEAGIDRARREAQANTIARPMRALFACLKTGEVDTIDGKPVMLMPDLDERVRQSHTDWVEIAPAIFGWIDLWARIAPDIDTQHLRYLAERLQADKPLTPRLVEQAQAEFECCVDRIPDMPPGAIGSAITTTQIAWELEATKDAA